MMQRDYRVGEVVLMQWRGWLKAFRVARVHRDGAEIEYTLALLGMENEPGWIKPDD